MLNREDIETCARALAVLASDQEDEVRTSLAWVFRNRIEVMQSKCETPPSIVSTCESVLREALSRPCPLRATPGLSDAEWRRIKAATCLVWSGDVADRTHGAAACHRHDSNPRWARKRTPIALLGSYLFYR